jgi:hypothetical protein
VKLVYIVGPLRDPSCYQVMQNIMSAREWALRVAECGAMPICPHTNTGSLYGAATVSEDHWLEGNLVILGRCDGAFFLPKWRGSDGAQKERAFCVRQGIVTFEVGHYPAVLSSWARAA